MILFICNSRPPFGKMHRPGAFITINTVCHYFATNKKIAITHLWHAMGPQTMYHLIAKDKVAEQHI